MRGIQRQMAKPIMMIALCILGSALVPGNGYGQQKESRNQLPEGFKLPNKEKRFTSAELLAQFEAPVEESYLLGAGDQISLDVWGRPELSGKHIVGPDGRIALPLLGAVEVAGLDNVEAAAAVRKGYVGGEFYLDIAATVRVDKFTSNRVYLLGRVAHPGVIDFDTAPTLLEALTRAGSLPIGGVGADKAGLARCAIFRGREKVVWVNLKPLFANGDLSLNLRLQRNDLIYIPDSDDQLIYVMGEVQRPGAYRLSAEMSFMDALMLAGGPTKDAGEKLRVIRPGAQSEREIRLGDLIRPDGKLNVSLEEGDIIYVGKRNLAKFGYVMERLTPFSSMLLLGSTLIK